MRSSARSDRSAGLGAWAARFGCLAATALTLMAPAQAAGDVARPTLRTAEAAILVDARDGHVLAQKDPDERRAMASATKLMTALLALERARLDQVLTAPEYSALPVESKIGLREGERMTVGDLLKALLLESANDAAVTLAEGIAGSRPAFVREMNERARELRLTGTSYANPIGLDDPRNHSTARDLATLARRLLRDRRFARIVDMPSAVLRSGARRRVVDNRNDLVRRFPVVGGVKTGHTLAAGHVLVGAARRREAEVVSVVMGEPSREARDADTLALLRYGLSRFRRVRALRRGEQVATARVEHRDERVALVPASDVTLTVRRGEPIERRLKAPEEVEGPLPAGRPVGSVTLLRAGRPIGRVELVTAAEVPGAGALRALTSALGLALTFLLVAAILGIGVLTTLRLRVRLRVVRGRRSPTR